MANEICYWKYVKSNNSPFSFYGLITNLATADNDLQSKTEESYWLEYKLELTRAKALYQSSMGKQLGKCGHEIYWSE